MTNKTNQGQRTAIRNSCGTQPRLRPKVSQANQKLCEQIIADAGIAEFAVFAYGSLMWNPEFEPTFMVSARIYGYARRPCIYSVTYRGTPERPGLVLGLDQGGSCTGIALGLPAHQRAECIRMLFDREMFRAVYRPHVTNAYARTTGRTIRCLTFIADRSSDAYIAPMPAAQAHAIITSAHGERGRCVDYWRATQRLLAEHNIKWDPGFPMDDG